MAGRVMDAADDDESGALLDAGQLQLFDRVGDLVQVLLREVQIPGCHLQILMTEQKLDGAQVRTSFQQVRGPTVSNQVRACGLTNAGLFGRLRARQPHRLVADRLLAIAMQP